MLHIKDLRIGNKVSGTGLHEGRVLTIRTMEYFDDAGFVLFFKEHDEGEYLRDCLPIPITGEILEQAGFAHKNLGPLQQYVQGYNAFTRDHLMVLEWSERCGYFFYNNAAHPIKYVHQLQNLYQLLTGEELHFEMLPDRLLYETGAEVLV
ncbi:hypothetical protein [Paracnuella aquatica]|uniref:hypothetical protein n=1 Tax=Paracnuella aquatica TaxID=2268757 RepID=UPI000DEF5BE0|nr:hypothetical protein [Paracnuella aquatica]RPD45592.1 hypothetical protein DRJ53_15430 [Paracnuella aquatica]